MTDTKVLIIDDEPENIRYVSTILEENGFSDIHSAADGVEGLARVKELMPGLIILDVRMPRKNGIAVFNELKHVWRYKDIPIIILTGEGEFIQHLAELRQYHENGENGAEAGDSAEAAFGLFTDKRPEAFLEKPIEPEALVAAVNQVLA
jgi:two-component system alkaline phosphatase synthesis response regulator PhoP